MNKRKRFVLISFLLTLGLLGIQFFGVERRYLLILMFTGLAVLMSLWSLFAELTGAAWFMAMVLPALYPASVALFYFLLPSQLLGQIILLFLFGFGMYALLLTENIYSVAAIRTIQLLRAAHAVGFLLTIITTIFLVGTLYSLKMPFWINGVGVFFCLFPLLLQGEWAVLLTPSVGRKLWVSAFWCSWIGALLAMTVSFLPMAPLVSALLVSGYVYVVLGLTQHNLQERLFAKTVHEYVGVGIIVLAAALLVTYLR